MKPRRSVVSRYDDVPSNGGNPFDHRNPPNSTTNPIALRVTSFIVGVITSRVVASNASARTGYVSIPA